MYQAGFLGTDLTEMLQNLKCAKVTTSQNSVRMTVLCL